MKRYVYVANVLYLTILFLCGCTYRAVQEKYDVRIKTDINSLEVNVGGETEQMEIIVDSYSYQELSSEKNIYISYHILSTNGEIIDYDGTRTQLTPIKARDKKKEKINIVAPQNAGEYILEIDLIEEGVTWFSEQGMETVRIPLTVLQSYDLSSGKILLHSEEESINMVSGDRITIPIQINNVGDMPLYCRGKLASKCSYHIKDQDGKYINYEGKRISLTEDILPGDSGQMELYVDESQLEELGSGKYIIEVDLVIEGVTWFSQKGMAPLEIPLTIAELQPASVSKDIFTADTSDSSIQDVDENVNFLWSLIRQTEHNTNRKIQLDLGNGKRSFYGYAAGDNYPQFWVRDNNTAVYAARYLTDVSYLNSWIELHLMHQDSRGGHSGLGKQY